MTKLILEFFSTWKDADNNAPIDHKPTSSAQTAPKTPAQESKRAKSDKDIMDEYGLDDYDNDEAGDESGVKNLLGIGELSQFADPGEDPYLDQEQPDEDEEDLEDFRIRFVLLPAAAQSIN